MTKKSSFDSSFSKVLFAHLLPFQAYLSLGKQRKERVDLSVFVIYSILAEICLKADFLHMYREHLLSEAQRQILAWYL